MGLEFFLEMNPFIGEHRGEKMIQNILFIVNIVASFVTIMLLFMNGGFKKDFRMKFIIFLLLCLIGGLSAYLVNIERERTFDVVQGTEMRRGAKELAASINVSGYSEAGDCLGHLMNISNFYARYSEYYPGNKEYYASQVKFWQELINSEMEKEGYVTVSKYKELRGIVGSSKNYLSTIGKEQVKN